MKPNWPAYSRKSAVSRFSRALSTQFCLQAVMSDAWAKVDAASRTDRNGIILGVVDDHILAADERRA